MYAPRDSQTGRYFPKTDRSLFTHRKAKPAPEPAPPPKTGAFTRRRPFTPTRKQPKP